MRDRITFQYGSHAGVSMAKQLVLSVTAKACLLVVDTHINSLLNVHKNVYQVFRFAGRSLFCVYYYFKFFISL